MRRIGRYAILGLLGRGGMGAVFKAAMPRTGRVVALKLLKPAEMLAATADPEALRRAFFREAALMAGIRHPGVAQVLDVDEDALGRPFFVMEYYCCNLGAQLGEGYRVEEPTRRLDVARSLDLARQLASALRRLHAEGVVHRDVKPFNLMLAETPGDWPGAGTDGLPRDEVKLIDFGLSRLRGEVDPLRAKGAVAGSPYYAAPEQERSPALADARADIFAAGVTLFRCLTGRLPQEGILASALRPGLDEAFDAFFSRCCAEDPGARPQSARALLTELDALAVRWVRLREAACALAPEEPAAPGLTEGQTPRAKPVRQPLARARERFGLDALWRPLRPADPARFAPEGEDTVRDSATGLLWQRAGSAYPLSLAHAREYAAALSAQGLAGRSDWRLPTAEELATLLLPEPDLRSLCVAPAFSPAQRRLWSADAKSFTAGWYADMEHGFVWWQDATCGFSARCVAGPL